MSTVTLELPDSLANYVRERRDDLTEIIECGLRGFEEKRESDFEEVRSVLEFFAGLPSDEEVLSMKPSPEYEKRIDELIKKSREDSLRSGERAELERFEYVTHLV